MTRMKHRRCKAYRSYRCWCHVPYGSYGPGGVTLTTQSSSLQRLLGLSRTESVDSRTLDVREESYTKSAVMRTLEAFYQSCAAYNMRYCPFTGFVKRGGNYFRHMMKDVVILICFFITNFVIFITIVAKIIVHMFFVLLTTGRWISRAFFPHPDMFEECFCHSSPPQPYQCYCPHQYYVTRTPVPSPKATYRLYE